MEVQEAAAGLIFRPLLMTAFAFMPGVLTLALFVMIQKMRSWKKT